MFSRDGNVLVVVMLLMGIVGVQGLVGRLLFDSQRRDESHSLRRQESCIFWKTVGNLKLVSELSVYS